jgi:hypothetical protein
MNWLRSHGWFYFVLLLLAALLAWEVGLWVQAHGQSRHTLAVVGQLTREANQLSRVVPEVGEKSVRAIREEAEKAEQVLSAWRKVWPAPNDSLAAVPTSPPSLDDFFEHLAWIERTRALAVAAQVAIAPEEHFGFALLTHEGPPAELAVVVRRQRWRLNYILQLLFAAHPRAVLSVQREQPLPLTPPSMSSRPPKSVPAAVIPDADYFIPDARLLIRSDGHCSSEAYRLEFSGETPVLRSLLNSLASGAVPILVRSVTVEKLTAVTPTKGNMGTSPPLVSGSLVTPAPSRFVVVVEWIDPPSPPGKTAA